MNEFRLDPESLSFSLVTKRMEGCKICREKRNELLSVPFRNGFVKIYDITDDIQPSKYELTGDFFKTSNADGYEEVLVENEKHEDHFKDYSVEEIEKLLSIISDRLNALEKYELGKTLVVKRSNDGHGYFDLLLLQIPKKESKACFECESVKMTGGREIYKTENFVVYVPFAPKSSFELVISPKKHIAFKTCDPILLFDLAGVVKKVLNLVEKKASWAIMESSHGHFKIKIFEGEVNPYEMLGISRIEINPDVLAQTIRDSKKI